MKRKLIISGLAGLAVFSVSCSPGFSTPDPTASSSQSGQVGDFSGQPGLSNKQVSGQWNQSCTAAGTGSQTASFFLTSDGNMTVFQSSFSDTACSKIDSNVSLVGTYYLGPQVADGSTRFDFEISEIDFTPLSSKSVSIANSTMIGGSTNWSLGTSKEVPVNSALFSTLVAGIQGASHSISVSGSALTLLSNGNPLFALQAGANPAPHLVTLGELQGTWSGVCDIYSSSGVYINLTYKFTPDGVALLTAAFYSDAACSMKFAHEIFTASYGLLGLSQTTAGVTNFNLVANTAAITLLTSALVTAGNSAQACGVSNWVLNMPVTVPVTSTCLLSSPPTIIANAPLTLSGSSLSLGTGGNFTKQ
ncbi:MAG: hypothetical protein C5B49_16235 [Bdellovibrio sp.]|nr:MAG: hypothetical protein C5B49_16235 [Bdellovibrio sp.]